MQNLERVFLILNQNQKDMERVYQKFSLSIRQIEKISQFSRSIRKLDAFRLKPMPQISELYNIQSKTMKQATEMVQALEIYNKNFLNKEISKLTTLNAKVQAAVNSLKI